MKSITETAAVDIESLVAEVADRFTEEVKQRRSPSVEEYAQQHPAIAGIIRQVFPALAMLDDFSSIRLPGEKEDGHVTGVLGDFRILRELGRGGMGVVYEADQISLGRRVALKVLPFAAMLDKQQLARFRNEARAAATLDHPNIVAIFYVGSERSVHFYAMQLVEGQSLAQMIAELRRVRGIGVTANDSDGALTATFSRDAAAAQRSSEPGMSTPVETKRELQAAISTIPDFDSREYHRAIARLGIQAAEALDHAHQNGILHRDVKPANLLVDETGRLWITDFGLARIEQDAGMTMSGDLLGTLRYMSPEQALAKRVVVDHRSDIYSLGVTLYELITLQPAYAANDRQELLRQIAFEEPRKPRQINSRIPQDLETIILKAIERNPADRYATARDLADDLRRFLDDRPITAKRQKLVASVRKWSRRNRPVVWATAATLTVSGLVLAGSIGWAVRDAKARQTEAERSVTMALEEAKRNADQGKWTDALSAVKRAESLVPSGDSADPLVARVEDVRRDIEMVLRLEDIRLNRSDAGADYAEYARTDSIYAQAFRDYGIDLEALEPDEASDRIRQKSIRLELALALDNWASIRRNRQPDEQSWKRLVEVARAGDPDKWRNQLRDALESPNSERKEALLKLVDSLDVEILPAPTAVLLGRALQEAGDFERAVALLKAAQVRYPGDLFVNRELAWSYFKLEPPNLDEARRFYTAALALRPTTVALYNDVSNTTTNLDEAIVWLKQAIRLDPAAWYLHSNFGQVLRWKGVPDQAIPFFKEAIRADPDQEDAYFGLSTAAAEAGALDELIAYYKEGIRLESKRWLAHKYLAQALAQRGLSDDAITHLKEAIRIAPDNAQLHLGLAGTLRRTGALEEAIASYKGALRYNKPRGPKDTRLARDAHVSIAELLRKTGALDEAIAHFKEAIRLDPSEGNAHQGLGESLADKGLREEAIPSLIEARRSIAYNGVPHVYASGYLHKMGALDEAIAFFSEKLRIEPDDASAHYGVGHALLDKGELDLAIDHFKQALRLRPEMGSIYLPLATAYRQKGALDEAIECFEELIPTTPRPYDADARLAHLLANWPDPAQRQPAKAVELAKKAVNLAPSLSDMVWIELGTAHYRNGQWHEAREAFDQALRRGGAASSYSDEDGWKFLWLAMIHWQLGDKAAARTWYDKAVERIENPPADRYRSSDISPDELVSLRAEAAELLGVEIPPTEKSKIQGAEPPNN